MSQALDQFKQNISRVGLLVGVYDSMSGKLTSAVDLSDMLRAAHVMAVSALDYYIHEIVRVRMIEIYDGIRPVTLAYNRFRLSMECLISASSALAIKVNLEADIRAQHSYLSFQQPDKIADAVRLVSDVKLWEEVAVSTKSKPKDVKDQIVLIVDRRNKIAHEADMDPTYPNARWPIKSDDVQESILFICDVVEAIDGLLEFNTSKQSPGIT